MYLDAYPATATCLVNSSLFSRAVKLNKQMGDSYKLSRPHMTQTEHKTLSVAPKSCRNSGNEESNLGGQRGALMVLGSQMGKDREVRDQEKTNLAGAKGVKPRRWTSRERSRRRNS